MENMDILKLNLYVCLCIPWIFFSPLNLVIKPVDDNQPNLNFSFALGALVDSRVLNVTDNASSINHQRCGGQVSKD